MRRWWWHLSDRKRAILKVIIAIMIILAIIVAFIALIVGWLIPTFVKWAVLLVTAVILLVVFGGALNFR